METKQGQRRRGEALKADIYAATLRLVDTENYEAVTYQAVAKLAKTSRSVIYRNWPDIFDLIYEALRSRALETSHGSVLYSKLDSGSLRGDLFAIMRQMRENAAHFPKDFLAVLLFRNSQGLGLTHTFQAALVADEVVMARIFKKAAARGELRVDISPEARLLPFQLLRYYMMLEGIELDETLLTNLIDGILLPLYLKN